MRTAVSAVLLATLASGCYFGKTTANRRNATIVNASLVFLGSVAMLHEPEAMGRLPTSADSGDEIAGTTRMLAGAAAITAGIAGIVMNLRTPAPEEVALPATAVPMAVAEESLDVPGGGLTPPRPYPRRLSR
jgi:hypothetical protein